MTELSSRPDGQATATRPESSDSRVVAAVDLGSNSFHMIVAQLSDSHLHVVDRLREPVRLAAGLGDSRRISEEAQRRALDCLQRFGQRLRGFPSDAVRAVGTNTLRAAHNAGNFLALAEEALGHPIDIISGVEEARMIYTGVARSLTKGEEQRLVVDIGGGSTELIIGRGLTPTNMDSLYMGCVSATKRWFPDGRITTEAFAGAETAAAQELESVQARYLELGWQEAIGASGTARAIARVASENGWGEPGRITRDGLKSLRKALIAAQAIDSIGIPGLSKGRAAVFPGGVAIMRAIFRALNIDTLYVASGALREGLLYDLVGRIRHEDIRDQSVAALAKRFDTDIRQAARVGNTAVRLLKDVRDSWHLHGEQAEQLLEWGGHLHEIGIAVAYNQYHKHGAYILRNTHIAGFSYQEQAVLARLVRAHRRRFPVDELKQLPPRWVRTATRLAVLLRLAAALNRSRTDAPLPPMRLEAQKKQLRLLIPTSWLDENPLTRADLDTEVELLSAAGYGLEVVQQ